MRKIIIIQHVAHEPLGTLNPMLKAAGFRIRYVNFARNPDLEVSLEEYSGLIVLGGPMGVYEAEQYPHIIAEMKIIEQAIKKNIPVLGICLGAQLIAHVLGSEVRKAPTVELGWYDIHLTDIGKKDPLFSAYQKTEKIFQLHQDMFDPPKTAEHLAFSDQIQGQAFRYGDKVYGFQFHLESDKPMILRWLHRHDNRKFIQNSEQFDGVQIEQQTELFINRSLELSAHSFGKFIDIFQLPKKKVLLGSR